MNLSSSTRAAIAVLEALYAQQDRLINCANFSYEVKPETEVQMFDQPVQIGKTWRNFEVEVRRDGEPHAFFEITLLGEDYDHSWKRADITMSPFGCVYRHFTFKALWVRGQGWRTRETCLIASSHGYGAMEYDSGFLLDPLPSSMKKVTPTPQPA